MRLGIVRDLIAHARAEREGASVSEFRVQLTAQAKQDVALGTPMVGDISRRVLHHAHPYITKLSCAPTCHAALTRMFGDLDL